jgi:hypothetical protein
MNATVDRKGMVARNSDDCGFILSKTGYIFVSQLTWRF